MRVGVSLKRYRVCPALTAKRSLWRCADRHFGPRHIGPGYVNQQYSAENIKMDTTVLFKKSAATASSQPSRSVTRQ